jgi:hypothetical protein
LLLVSDQANGAQTIYLKYRYNSLTIA